MNSDRPLKPIRSSRRKLRVGVVFGGRSGEHAVSLISAQSVMRAMNPAHYEVIPIGITKQGSWVVAGDVLQFLQSGVGDVAPAALLADPARQAVLELSQGQELETVLRSISLDVVFPVLHGPLGEDGTIQGLLELANIPYVGAGVMASAVAMDKIVAKDIFAAHQFPIVRYLAIKRKSWEAAPKAVIDQVEREIGYDCFIKPACLGSSVGISKAHNRTELSAGLTMAARYDRKLLVEAAVPNAREIEVAVLGNDEPIASVAGEIIPCREFYDYRAKYIDDRSELLIPAPLSMSLSEQIRQLAVQAYLAVDCAGMARVDFLVERDSERFYLSEINTIPGFTSISMYPKLWEASGIPYSELIDRLIELALERHADKNKSQTTFEPDW